MAVLLFCIFCCNVITVGHVSGSSEDLSAECLSTPAATTPQTPVMRSPLKTTAAGSSAAVKRRTRTTSASYTSAGDGPVVRSGTRIIYTAGRPPWYDSQGQLKEAFVIGVSIIMLQYCNCS